MHYGPYDSFPSGGGYSGQYSASKQHYSASDTPIVLDTPSTHGPAHAYEQNISSANYQETNPLPWDPLRVNSKSPALPESHALRPQYQSRLPSDTRSRANHSDEGYYTAPAPSQLDTRSVLSDHANNSMLSRNQGLSSPQSSSPDGPGVLQPSAGEPSYVTGCGQFATRGESSVGTTPPMITCSEPSCDWTGKTASEQK